MKPNELTQRGFDNIDDLLAAYDAAVQSNKWISVKDRLPEKSGYYLRCKMEHGVEAYPDFVESTYYSAAHKMWNCRDWHDLECAKCTAIDGITHWMPLPDPPEVETCG